MTIVRKLRKAGRRLTKAEAKATRAAAPRPESFAGKAAATIGTLGDQPELRTLSAIVIAGGLVGANRRLFRTGIRMLLAHELATLAKNFVKDEVDRTRPHSASSPGDETVKPGKHHDKARTSFPSGHSAGSTAVGRAVSREYPQYAVPALAAATVVSGLQVPRLNHYPTDIAAGMAVGAVSEALSALVFVGDEDTP